MKKFPLVLLAAIVIGLNAASTLMAQQPAPVSAAPIALGAHVPDAITQSTREQMRCLTAEAHFDACVLATFSNLRYVVGWDESAFAVTYLFTNDTGFRTKNNLAVGGNLRVTRSRLVPFKSWQVDPRSGSGGWFPVVVPLDLPSIVGQEDETSALIVGFVQTVYLNERVFLTQ
jgi:hypothetical protein